MQLYKLSICVPTYNRAIYLLDSLDSIIKSVGDKYQDVEIIVSDNNSTDNTREVAEKIGKNFKNFVYKKNEKNVGALENLYLAASYAKSEYVWFFSDDDLMEKSAVSRVLELIDQKFELVIINFSDWSLNMDAELCKNVIPLLSDKVFEGAEKLMEQVGFHISFICSIVIKKHVYAKHTDFLMLKDTGFPHVYFVYNYLMQKKTSAYYISTPLIRHRIGNESDFGDYSFAKYIVNGTSKIVKLLIECGGYDQKSIARFRRQIFWGWIFTYFYNLKRNNKNRMIDLRIVFDSYHFSYFTIIIFFLKYIPVSFLKVLIRIKKFKFIKK